MSFRELMSARGNQPLQLLIPVDNDDRAVDLSHSSGTERAGDLERADSLADYEALSRIE